MFVHLLTLLFQEFMKKYAPKIVQAMANLKSLIKEFSE